MDKLEQQSGARLMLHGTSVAVVGDIKSVERACTLLARKADALSYIERNLPGVAQPHTYAPQSQQPATEANRVPIVS